MLRTKRLDDHGVAKLKVKGKRYAVPDPELRGHYIRVSATGLKSFWVVARDPSGRQHWRPIDAPTIEKARGKRPRSSAPSGGPLRIASALLLPSGVNCIASPASSARYPKLTGM